MTGSYSNNFSIYNRETKDEIPLQADKSAFKAKRLVGNQKKMTTTMGRNGKREDLDPVDFNKKILHASWHPKENIIAVAATNNLFIFAQVSLSLFILFFFFAFFIILLEKEGEKGRLVFDLN